MKTLHIVFLALLMTGVASAQQTGISSPTIAVVPVDNPPVIDGSLNDACWRKAVESTQFHVTGTSIPAVFSTSMRLVSTPKALYVAFSCDKGKPPVAFNATDIGRDGNVFSEDSIEMFLQPDTTSEKYYQFVANPTGSRYDGRGRDREWDGDWKAAAMRTRTGWTLELEIRFATWMKQRPPAGTQWGFSVCRNEVIGKEYSSWAEISGGNHDWKNFGRIVFVKPVEKKPRVLLVYGSGESPLYVSPGSIVASAPGIKLPARLAKVSRLDIRNPSFERGLSGWAVEFPSTTKDAVPVTIDDKVSATGKRAVCVVSSEKSPSIALWQKVWSPPVGAYKLSCLVKSDSTKIKSNVRLYADFGGNIEGDSVDALIIPVKDTLLKDGWCRQSVKFVVPSRTPFVRIRVDVKGRIGKVWLDEFTCKRIK